jgi:hypothetical protein
MLLCSVITTASNIPACDRSTPETVETSANGELAPVAEGEVPGVERAQRRMILEDGQSASPFPVMNGQAVNVFEALQGQTLSGLFCSGRLQQMCYGPYCVSADACRMKGSKCLSQFELNILHSPKRSEWPQGTTLSAIKR